MNNLSDETSHDLQNDIDVVLDLVKTSTIGSIKRNEILNRLEVIRDNIPCSCWRRHSGRED